MRLIPLVAGLVICGSAVTVEARPPNVLVIAVDDLRAEPCYSGAADIHSPHIDALAGRGIRFSHAYCQYALCGPSRASVFTGCRPDTTRVYGNRVHFRAALPDVVSLPQHFLNRGYFVRGFGKILHDTQDDPVSWSEPFYFVRDHLYARPENRDRVVGIDGIHESNSRNPLFESADVPDNAYRDGMITDEAVATLRRVADGDRPFLLMVGYHKPHTPFNAPTRYWDLYDREQIALAPNPFPPRHVPAVALSDWRYVRSFKDIPDKGPLPDELAREVRHAYFACISYIDAQVGRLLSELDGLDVADNTIVVLWSDHGYQLGEHGMWCKHTNFETSTRVPLIIADPRLETAGRTCSAVVELVDLYPTLADLCGHAPPDHLEGQSLRPLLHEPDAEDYRDSSAFSQYMRNGHRGVSLRTRRFRYTEWRHLRDGELTARELYDHASDPQENENRIDDARYAEVLSRLSRRFARRPAAVAPAGRR